MPTGIYYRSPEMKKQAAKCLALGRTKKARIKAAITIRRISKTESFINSVREGTKRGLAKPGVWEKYKKSYAKYIKEHGPNFRGGRHQEPTGAAVKGFRILKPLGFVQEHPLRYGGKGIYLLDFAHVEKKIDIELDGPSHRKATRRRKDAERDLVVKRLGWRVIRIPHKNVDVFSSEELALLISKARQI